MRWLLPFALVVVAAAPAEVLTIGGERFPQADVLDARAVADGEGPAIFVTFTDAASKRFSMLKARWAGKPIPILLGDKPLTAPMILDPGSENNFQIPGAKTFPDAEALARRISGKAPLPESLEE
jgi:preprotein translocase subunit SecD